MRVFDLMPRPVGTRLELDVPTTESEDTALGAAKGAEANNALQKLGTAASQTRVESVEVDGPAVSSRRPASNVAGRPLCNACGRSVLPGSGRFVNRVPVLNSVEERREMGKPFPAGNYLCAECAYQKSGEDRRCRK